MDTKQNIETITIMDDNDHQDDYGHEWTRVQIQDRWDLLLKNSLTKNLVIRTIDDNDDNNNNYFNGTEETSVSSRKTFPLKRLEKACLVISKNTMVMVVLTMKTNKNEHQPYAPKILQHGNSELKIPNSH